MEQLIDVSCIKKEYTEANNADKYNVNMEKVTVNELDIGPVKIEPGVSRAIKVEWEEAQPKLESEEKAVSGKTDSQRPQAAHQLPAVSKSNNRRIVVRELHQRLLKLDMAIQPSNRSAAHPRSLAPSKSSAQRMREMRQRRRNADSAPHPATGQRMQDLRQRLMNLEQRIKLPASRTSSQRSLEPHSRLLQPKKVQTPVQTENKSSETRTPPKSSAQRMRELRQRRRDLQNDNKSAEQKSNTTSSRPQTPPDLSVKRMREFRQRLLELDKSHKGKHSESMRKTDQVRIS
ncbi:uncharacterized protein [Drosophila virilis]|uniref:Uncharacterized protein n=1 Tax=Drosophila virilis TaxID=7244 RepID=A0A0Q9WGP1_DROVI|nr:uncharacterized protein LOC26530570 [Drosophila virilis]KRF81009.1 uncharacterized protein Dvir_GJ25800 [Drosophila virilis]